MGRVSYCVVSHRPHDCFHSGNGNVESQVGIPRESGNYDFPSVESGNYGEIPYGKSSQSEVGIPKESQFPKEKTSGHLVRNIVIVLAVITTLYFLYRWISAKSTDSTDPTSSNDGLREW